MRRAQTGHDVSVLQALRQVFTSLAIALVLIGFIAVTVGADIDDESSGPSLTVVAAVVGAYGLFSLVVPRLLDRPLDCSSEGALVTGYRTRFFLRIAFADAAALGGFVGTFIAHEAWVYPLGAFFAAIGFVRLAPSNRNLELEQLALNQRGCGLSLRGLLLAARPASAS
jgi:hypothetical protein